MKIFNFLFQHQDNTEKQQRNQKIERNAPRQKKKTDSVRLKV